MAPHPPMVIPKREVNQTWGSTSSIAQPLNRQIINDGPPPLKTMASSSRTPPSIITNETPKMNSNLNNLVFFDGRPYEVSFFLFCP